MSQSNQSANSFDRTRIARSIFADAESMGLRDRDRIEQLTNQVIERLEHPQPLPGMEHLIPKTSRQPRRLPTESEIQAMVREILAP